MHMKLIVNQFLSRYLENGTETWSTKTESETDVRKIGYALTFITRGSIYDVQHKMVIAQPVTV